MQRYAPDFEHFKRLSGSHNRVPITATLICDELTPVSAFARLERGAEHAFLFESVIGGEKIARYSFIGANPRITFEATRNHLRVFDHQTQQTLFEGDADDPLKVFEDHLAGYRVATLPNLPRLLGGAVGFAGYDAIRYYEHLPDSPADDRELPDLLFNVYDTMVVFDHVYKTVLLAAHAEVPDGADEATLRRCYDAAVASLDTLIATIGTPVNLAPVQIGYPMEPLSRYTSNFRREDFEQAVEKCREYIRAGDIFQVVISQRLQVDTPAAPFDIYRALRVINPSPFMFYVKAPQLTLVGASPEIMCRVDNGIVTNRPLAGTRRRGATEAEDRRLRDELLADPKERAEHVMLVDLGRNDVGRVCRPGSIQLSDVMEIEYYSHVMHICSNVSGELAGGRSAWDALRATLPVGTVSGAPKVRAMEIIDEIEPTRRGPYAGAVGYVDFSGNMDTCIALRTLVIQPGVEGTHHAFIQAGAGIVADSVPTREFEETISKAKGMLTAIGVAEQCFLPNPAQA
jgi:anthranilate synthase component 1